ncbi:MAG: hypothetical protein PHC68_11605 [Syntrophorhabdaceae bacterium]|nr:hypothetical protein [Syntrophorhabdaceae bacterium]
MAGKKVWIFDPGRFTAFLGGLLLIGGVVAGIRLNCANATAYAKENIVRPVAVSVFKEMHVPYEKKMQDQCYDIKLVRMMLEEMVSDKVKNDCIKKLNDTTWKTR